MPSKYLLTKQPINKAILVFILITILLALGGIGGMMYIRQMYNLPPKKQGAGIPVKTVTAVRGDMIKSLKYTGTIESYYISSPAAKINERVEKVAVREGDRVNPGDLLVSLSATELQSKVNTLSRRVETALLNVKHLDEEVQVYKVLSEENAISQREYENIVYKRDSAVATLHEAEAFLAEGQAALENTIICSGIAGMVAMVNVEVGNQAVPGQPLVSIVDPDNLKVIIHVMENDLPLMQPGIPVKVIVLGGDVIEASVGRTYPTLDSKTRSAKVEISLPSKQVQDQKVFSGMSADVQVILDQQSDVILLPIESVIERQGKSYVFLVKGEKAVQMRVKTGISDGNKVEIIDGLNEGDKIVLRPPSDLRDGQTVYLFNEVK